VIRDVLYCYDPNNQLVRRISSEGNSFLQTVFVHEDGQTVLQFDSTTFGNPTTANLSHRYLWGAAVDELLADERVSDLFNAANNETLWALTDHQGSVRDVVDSNADLRIHRRFDGFGNFIEQTHYDSTGAIVYSGQAGYVDEAFAFTGRYFDKATALQNNLNRWYDPSVGRWLSEDPIGFDAGDANLYRYVGNSPTMQSDPLGLEIFAIDYMTQIEANTVTYMGRTFNGGMKTRQTVVIDTNAPKPIVRVNNSVGSTIEFLDDDTTNTGTASGNSLTATVTEHTPSTIVVQLEGNEGNPLAPWYAAGITYSATITIDLNNLTVSWAVEHDQYPSHTLMISQQGSPIPIGGHNFSHVGAGTDPDYLIPTNPNHSANGSSYWRLW
jgi:RHS repeat-associated protein